jgi:hypothetical protein
MYQTENQFLFFLTCSSPILNTHKAALPHLEKSIEQHHDTFMMLLEHGENAPN